MSNSGFRCIKNSAGQLSDLNASDALISNLTAGDILAGDILLSNHGYQEGIVVGFAPTGFSAAVAGTILNLLSGPRLAAAITGTDPNLISLPAGAVVKRIHVDNNGSPLGAAATTLDIGHGAFGAATTNLLAVTPIATVDGLGGAYRNFELDLTNGVAAGQNPPAAAVVAAAPANLVFVEVNAATIGAGDLRVAIEYCNAITL